MFVPSLRTIIWGLRCPGSLQIAFCVLWCLGLTGTSKSLVVAEKRQLSIPTIDYEKAKIRDAYNNSSSQFDYRGMEGLYVITNIFLDGIQPKSKKLPQDSIDKLLDYQKYFTTDKTIYEFLLYQIGIVIVGCIGIVLALLVPFIGLICCCCRCAGKCGGKLDPMEKKKDRYRRISMTAALSFLTLLMTFGLICAFVTNEYADQSLRQFPSRAKSHIQDVKLFANNTDLEIKQLLIENFNQLHRHISIVLRGAGQNIKSELGRLTDLIHIMDLEAIVSGLDKIDSDLKNIMNSSGNLQKKSAELSHELINMNRTVQDITKKICQSDSNSCSSLQQEANKLGISTDFTKLPNVSSQAENIQGVLNRKVKDKIQKAISVYDSIGKDIQDKLNNSITDVNQLIIDVGKVLKEEESRFSSHLQEIKFDNAEDELDKISPYIGDYSSYRWYAGISISCVVLLIVVAYILGILFGICGKRPGNVYGNDACNKGVGATFLLIANGLIIFFFFYLMLVLTVLFIMGAFVYVHACRTLDDPANSLELKITDHYFSIDKAFNPEIGLFLSNGEILQYCHENKPMYEVFKLDRIYNISDIVSFDKLDKKYHINEKIQKAFENLNVDLDRTFLDDETKEQLDTLAASNLSEINFTKFADELKSNLTLIRLDEFANKINYFADSDSTGLEEKEELYQIARNLMSIHKNLIYGMGAEIANLNASLKALEHDIKFNQSTLTEAVNTFKTKIINAEKFIRENGTSQLHKIALEMVDRLVADLKDYAARALNEITKSIGRCWPASQAINATIMDACQGFLGPFNGFWISIGYILIIFLPSMCIAYSLVGLYRKSDPYPGIIVETDGYHSGSFADRDTIPLAHVDKRKHPEQQGIINPNTMYDYSSESNTWTDDYSEGPQNRHSKALLNHPPPSNNYTRNDFRDWGYRNGHGSHMNGHPVGSRGYEVYPIDATRPPAYLYPGPDYK